MGQIVDLNDGSTGYLASSGKSDAPGIVVIQEWWGLQDQIKSVCDAYAEAGFDALAPALYAGAVVPYHDEEAAARQMDALHFPSATDVQVRAAAGYLQRPGRKIGLTGFCLGGIVSVLGAIRLDCFAAASCYYGLPAPEQGDPADVRIPIRGHFALADSWCTLSMVKEFEAGLDAAGKDHAFYIYDCDHGFFNPDIDEYDPKAATLAWQRDLAFWDEYLR
ncbi:dienelactone hydrolase family protein [Pararhizobium mangrovi]|uniref:Dienelactone hydrolase family protein n=1 Tax=Pararhizobium mangrovi TaxID=2590452 RepID=A0A506TXT5_9HYPH|nr:dienelactone hydrolase family protein [Pararhizobium mangrovi]TPW25771.1 dienelactone hydrolase family protein [Pararhizobium mangrovi]